MRIVKVYSTENCGACIKLEKALKRLNVPYEKYLNEHNGIRCYPTTILYDGNVIVERIEGFSPRRLNNIINFINSPAQVEFS